MDDEEKKGEEIAKEALKEGGVQALVYYDIHGSSPDTLKNILIGFVGKLIAEPGVLHAYGKIEKPQKDEVENEFYSSAEVKMAFRDFNSLAILCVKYMPIGIEILKPHEISLGMGEAQNMLLNIASITNEYAEELLKRSVSEEEKIAYGKKILKREELGRKLLEKKDNGE